LDIIFGHHILRMYLKHRLTNVCILRRISLVTSHVSHPYKSTDFTQALKILISVSFCDEWSLFTTGVCSHNFPFSCRCSRL
jgi:hypothetical protein